MKKLVWRDIEIVPDYNSDLPYDQREGEVWVDAHYEVCSACRGRGFYVNPAIDSNGITEDEMYELGDDFREDYMRGVYDVVCDGCDGRRVELVADPDKIDAETMKKIDAGADADNAYEAEREAERKMGA